jgi:hypothetical protein
MERKNIHAMASATTEAMGTSQKAEGIIIVVKNIKSLAWCCYLLTLA